jgi:hypothetical protein
MRRVWYYLRELVWLSIMSVALVAVSLVFLLLGSVQTAGVLAVLAVPFAILSTRS